MVFFICSHCGASLKKNKVEKHYAIQCRNPPQVSCMDCLKEFSGNGYVAHTKCITEDEKYSAKGFIPKPNSNKGECKQQEWLDVVRGVQQSQENLPKALKTVLDSIVNLENIPRKKPKFMNFLNNNHFKLRPNDVDQLWDLLEKAHKCVKENAGTSTEKNAAEKQSDDSTTESSKDSEVREDQIGNCPMEVNECENKPKDKTKKKKKNRAENTNSSEAQADESLQDSEKVNVNSSMEVDQKCEVTSKGKTKKKKNKECIVDNEQQANESLEKETCDNSSMEADKEFVGTPNDKTRKKKNKKEIQAEVMNDTERQEGGDLQVSEKQSENATIEVGLDIQTMPNGKTKKNRYKGGNGTEAMDTSEGQVLERTRPEALLTKKERKEKKKREKYEAELKEIESSEFRDVPPEEEDDDDNEQKKKNSKKYKNINGLDSKVNGVAGKQTEEISIKSKKKRHLDDHSAEPLKKKKKKETQDDEQAVETATAEDTNGLQKFQWNETILEAVKSKGGEIPVKRLRKKVVTEYQNYCGNAESEEKLTVKFNKKLLKVPGITVHKEVVKLME